MDGLLEPFEICFEDLKFLGVIENTGRSRKSTVLVYFINIVISILFLTGEAAILIDREESIEVKITTASLMISVASTVLRLINIFS